MIGTLILAVMATTPCEGLKALSLPNTTITTAEFIQEGVYTPPAPPRGAAPAAAPAGQGRGGGEVTEREAAARAAQQRHQRPPSRPRIAKSSQS